MLRRGDGELNCNWSIKANVGKHRHQSRIAMPKLSTTHQLKQGAVGRDRREMQRKLRAHKSNKNKRDSRLMLPFGLVSIPRDPRDKLKNINWTFDLGQIEANLHRRSIRAAQSTWMNEWVDQLGVKVKLGARTPLIYGPRGEWRHQTSQPIEKSNTGSRRKPIGRWIIQFACLRRLQSSANRPALKLNGN